MRAVFLDRDGVLNKAIVRDGKPYPPATLEEMEIVETAANVLRIERVGVWMLSEDGQSLRCIYMLEPSGGRHSVGVELKASDYPSYYAAYPPIGHPAWYNHVNDAAD